MDEARLKKIMKDIEIPTPDLNAKKRALNLAVAEFKTRQSRKDKKTFQGFPLLARLMGNTKDKQRRKTMEEKIERKRNKNLVYGGMMTAMALILIAAPIAMKVMHDNIGSSDDSYSATSLVPARAEIIVAPGTELASPAYINNSIQQIISPKKYRKVLNKAEVKTAMASRILQDKVVTGHTGVFAESEMLIAVDEIAPHFYQETRRNKFEDFKVNPIKTAAKEPVSTFSVDVDTASYSFVRKSLNSGRLPQKGAVRVEEMINYFDYNYPLPEAKDQPFKPSVAITPSPWAEGKKLLHIGIKGYDLQSKQPRSNLVFLLDVSGSMNAPDKLPLVKNSLKMLLDSLQPDDTIAIAVYAGAAGTVLEPTKVSERNKILTAMNKLHAVGSTAGAAGINLAYQLAEQNFDKNAVNRVILATDGDFNVGITSNEELKKFVERKRKTGVFLSVLGFGSGNLNDHLMQVLAQNGNGVAAYIDNLNEARKVLVEEAGSTLFPIAKDVKIQVEFNPAQIAEYRLVGYETRHLNREDFNNDKIDAGDIGAGHTVTAIYEITPVGSESVSVDPLRYGKIAAKVETEKTVMDSDFGNELAFLKIRYKLPNESKSKLITTPIQDLKIEMTTQMANDISFSTAVAGFGQLLKGGQYTGGLTYDDVITMAQSAKGEDKFGYRAEFISMVRLAKAQQR